MAIERLVIQVQESDLKGGEKENIFTLIEYTIQSKISPAFDYCNQRLADNSRYEDIIPSELMNIYDSIMIKIQKK